MPGSIVSATLRAAAAGISLLALLCVASFAYGQEPDPAMHGEDWEVGQAEEPQSVAAEPEVDESAAEPEPRPRARAARGAAPAGQAEVADTDPSALTDFEPELRPYGVWVNDPHYGLIWVPHPHVVGADFAPYVTSGHWALTPEGDWIWVSDYPFGWVVFHYGRWVWVTGTGWAWVPGRRYAHAWVLWRVPSSSYAYVGWAPAPPSYVWVNGVAVSIWVTPPCPYVFVPSAYVFSYHVHHYIVVDRVRLRRIAYHSRRYVPRAHAVRRGPSLAAARVPARHVPRVRTPANPRALSASRRTASRPRPVAAPGSKALSPAAPRLRAPARGLRRAPASRAARPGYRTSGRLSRSRVKSSATPRRRTRRSVATTTTPSSRRTRLPATRRLPSTHYNMPSRSYAPARLNTPRSLGRTRSSMPRRLR